MNKKFIKIGAVVSFVWVCVEVVGAAKLYLDNKTKKAYQKGITDCVDNFVRGFAFTNGTVTIESEHNGSITVKAVM